MTEELPELEEEAPEVKKPFAVGRGKTTPADRQWICEQVAEGLKKPSECAALYDVSIQFISQLLKKAKVTYGSKKKEREESTRRAIEAKEADTKATFAERRLKHIEEHKIAAINTMRGAFMLEGLRQQKWREAIRAGGAPPTAKESNVSARTVSILDQRIRLLLGMDEQVDEKELPRIDIDYMGDEEIQAIRRGRNIEEPLQSLDDDIIDESDL